MKQNSIMIITVLVCLAMIAGGCGNLNEFLKKETQEQAPQEVKKDPAISGFSLDKTFFKISHKSKTASAGIHIGIQNPDNVTGSCEIVPSIGDVPNGVQEINEMITAQLIIQYDVIQNKNKGDVIPGTITARLIVGNVLVAQKSISFNIYIEDVEPAETSGKILQIGDMR